MGSFTSTGHYEYDDGERVTAYLSNPAGNSRWAVLADAGVPPELMPDFRIQHEDARSTRFSVFEWEMFRARKRTEVLAEKIRSGAVTPSGVAAYVAALPIEVTPASSTMRAYIMGPSISSTDIAALLAEVSPSLRTQSSDVAPKSPPPLS